MDILLLHVEQTIDPWNRDKILLAMGFCQSIIDVEKLCNPSSYTRMLWSNDYIARGTDSTSLPKMLAALKAYGMTDAVAIINGSKRFSAFLSGGAYKLPGTTTTNIGTQVNIYPMDIEPEVKEPEEPYKEQIVKLGIPYSKNMCRLLDGMPPNLEVMETALRLGKDEIRKAEEAMEAAKSKIIRMIQSAHAMYENALQKRKNDIFGQR